MERESKIHIRRTRPLTGFEMMKRIGATNMDLRAVSRALHEALPGKFPEVLDFPGRKHAATDAEIRKFLGI